ncbi:SDR family NAD(P)-dependent oxidoreductase [Pseudonocardia sp. CA-107938]|uniref:SDR family NAD(P)-dependent oxidoreductase n=1 Tax=Pseudonocardia sp. CA-107938 TaxID=3240021 RepID=UPI003D8C6CE3
MFDGEGRVALVTGAATEPARRIATALAGRGMTLVLTDINEEHLDLVAAEWPGVEKPLTRRLDVTDSAGWSSLVAEIEAAVGPLHALVSAAEFDPGAVAVDLPPASWERAVAINLMGVVRGIAAVLPVLRRHGAGGLVVTTVPDRGAASSPHEATRIGTAVVMEALAVELEDESIRTVVVSSTGDAGASVLAALDGA